MRSPGVFRFAYEDETTLTIGIGMMNETRTIYLDDRPREEGPHTWFGHSLGEWQGERLTVITTHIRPRYLRRNGVTSTEDMVMTEHFLRTGDYLHLITIIEDPEYLTEPFVRSISYVKQEGGFGGGFGGGGLAPGEWEPCEPVEWPGGALPFARPTPGRHDDRARRPAPEYSSI